VKALMFACVECGFVVVVVRASSLDPLWASVFNAVGGRYVLSHQDALTVWYTTTETGCVSVLRNGTRDPGGAEWSCRRCTGSAFGRISISPTSSGHLTLAMTSRGSPCSGGGFQAAQSTLRPINRGLPIV
jgi:hypothetical protein